VGNVSEKLNSFNAKRKYFQNTARLYDHIFKEALERMKKVKTEMMDNYVTAYRMKVHRKPIFFTSFLQEKMEALLTSSSDGFFKIWDSELNCLCQLDIHKPKRPPHLWNFPFDWRQKKLDELDQIKVVMKQIEPKKKDHLMIDTLIEKIKKEGSS